MRLDQCIAAGLRIGFVASCALYVGGCASPHVERLARAETPEACVPPQRDVLVLRHTDAQWREDLSDLPQACRTEPNPLSSPREVVQRLAQIATRFRVESPCEQELILSAAEKVVLQNEPRIQEFLAGPSSGAAPR